MSGPTLLTPGKLAGKAGQAHPDEVPINYIINWIKRRMSEFGGGRPRSVSDRVLIIRSETGSGKSTALPVHIFRLLRGEKTSARVRMKGPSVICTQPRILTAQSLARDMAGSKYYPDMEMGVTVGYQTGPINERPASGLIYSTAGILLAQMRVMDDSEIMARYRFIIVDEAHERALEIDTLLMRLKAFINRNLGNARLPFLILASATIPVDKYARYFGVGPSNIIEVTGRQFPVKVHYPATGTNNYPVEAAKKAVEIHRRHPDDPPHQADILIFMPGAREIEMVVAELLKASWEFRRKGAKVRPYHVLSIMSEDVKTDSWDYRRLQSRPEDLSLISTKEGTFVRVIRRIIVASVVAETRLTLDALKYVVDGGWSRGDEQYFPARLRGIITRPAPKSRIRQRKGRAGRKFPGEFYPLYTENVYRALPSDQLPDIVQVGIAPIFLDVVEITAESHDGVFRVSEIDMLDPPPVDSLTAALEDSITYGFLRPDVEAGGHRLTPLGHKAARFNYLGMNQIQTIMAGYLWGVSIQDLALIVTLYEGQDALRYADPAHGDTEPPGARALRAGLPSFLGGISGGGRAARPPSEAESYYYRARLLISDNFIEALLAFEGFAQALSSSNGNLERLLEWCDANGVDFTGASQLAAMRDTVMNEMLLAGLNPFWGYEHRITSSTEKTFFEIVVRLKHCIYAGLRPNRLTYSSRLNTYQTRTGVGVKVPPAYTDIALARLQGLGIDTQHKPRRLVTNQVRLRPARGDKRDRGQAPFLYRVVPGMVSVLDGYIDTDEVFWAPRLAASDLAAGPAND